MKRIADYKTLQPLGSGAHGEVWVARPPARLGLPVDQVAVKILNLPVSQPEFAATLAELRIYARIESPYLITVYDVGCWNDRLYLSMEYFPLGSLAGPADDLGPSQRCRAISAAARGAHELHEAGIVHRGIKPSNILLMEDGAKLGEPSVVHLLAPGKTFTGTGSTGEVEFVEPGMVRGERPGRGTDVWSLGICLHHTLSGASVYRDLPDGSLLTLLRHIVASPPQLDPGLHPNHDEIVRRCVALDRADRYPTALALAEAIEQTELLEHA
ncbi:MAG: protein kinase [Nitriliruptorales bacterium]|nr:protein kinase [Nitriliruptorales bacterium]